MTHTVRETLLQLELREELLLTNWQTSGPPDAERGCPMLDASLQKRPDIRCQMLRT